MEIRSLGESKGNYTNSSIRQFKQKDSRDAKTEKNRSHSNNSSGNGQLAVGLLAGASVGILAGMLLAPERGRDMRKQIANSASKVGDQVNKAMDMCVTTCKDTMNSWTGKKGHEAPLSNSEMNGPANFTVSSDSGPIDPHIL